MADCVKSNRVGGKNDLFNNLIVILTSQRDFIANKVQSEDIPMGIYSGLHRHT